jgi:tryptophanyl-tRNA synthetase
MNSTDDEHLDSFATTQLRSDQIWARIRTDPSSWRVVTGERATGLLHVGHFFGSLENRIRLQELGVSMQIVIADYQALTDREASAKIEESVLGFVLDYLAIGLDPTNGRTSFFAHSYVPSLNQLLLPFLSMVSVAELQRNPTVKDEIKQIGTRAVSGLMLTYPVHQAADILFCHGNLVPGGKDQMPHLELSRIIARRFNEYYGGGAEIFEAPNLLLSDAPLLLGLDGRKMGKSLSNSIPLSISEDETAARIKVAKTDSQRHITYDPEARPEVSNLLLLAGLCRGEDPQTLASSIGDGGGGKLKQVVTEAVNERFRPMRARRRELEADLPYVRRLLSEGNARAESAAAATLDEVRVAMKMQYT